MLKKYDELTGEQKKRVTVMYSDQSTVQMYLYNFDEQGNYHGRQYNPEGMTIHAESTVSEDTEPVEKEVEDKKPVVRSVKKTKKK